jgi:hypothetical protein
MQKMPGQNHMQQQRGGKYGAEDEFILYLLVKWGLLRVNIIHYFKAKALNIFYYTGVVQHPDRSVLNFTSSDAKLTKTLCRPLLFQQLMDTHCTIIAMHTRNVQLH